LFLLDNIIIKRIKSTDQFFILKVKKEYIYQ